MQIIKFTIDILQEHIDKGKCGQAYSCAVALTLHPFILSKYFYSVGACQDEMRFIGLSPGGLCKSVRVSKEFTDFVCAFDSNKNVTPTTVQVWFKKSDFDHIPDLQKFINSISYMEMEIK